MLVQDPPDAVPGQSSKGLATGKIGTLAGAVLSIASIAPAYTTTASVGLIVAAVGLKMPALLIAGFIPMFLAAYAYREFSSDAPDCGASFTWSTRAFGPYVGWMAGWGSVIAVIIVLANIAAVGAEFLYLFVGRLVHSEWIAELGADKPVNIVTTLAFLAAAGWAASRGITSSERAQYVLVGFQLTVLLLFAGVALGKALSGEAPASLDFDIDWFNPFTGITLGAFAIGLVGSVFMFWGWDTALTLGEECKNPKRTPGRAGLLSILSVLGTYLLLAVALMMYAGTGETGVGLGNPESTDNVFGTLANPVLGSWGELLLFLAVLVSSIASLQATFLPAARALLAMGSFKALPSRFASVHPGYKVPRFAAAVAAIVAGGFFTITSLLSEHVLSDTIAAMGIMICWYYGITAFACVWYFRRHWFDSPRAFLFRLLFPLLGGAMLLIIFCISVSESTDPEVGSGASIFGVGLVFYLGFGVLAIGAVLMLVQRWKQPEFFRGATLPRAVAGDRMPEPAEVHI
ncbi:APC family permease [Nocardia sp. 2]|uniref:APC family permease n=1 Tax=Nocardia acididurans TaxID=2802282 RepID=A0ABS1M3C1_9NOCA|nr:APC family permease [Nocardia acididurans]MBL1075157.1 APC family permease [Nocardia acididurans]